MTCGISSEDDEKSDVSKKIDSVIDENQVCAVKEEVTHDDEEFSCCKVDSIIQKKLEMLISKHCKEKSELREVNHEKDAMIKECRLLRAN